MKLTILTIGALLCLISPLALAQSTATQAVLNYTASNAVNCTVEVSTSGSYSPLVKAVDSTIFSSANSDGQTNIGARQFVIGQRWVAQENVSPLSITVAGGNASRAPLAVRASPSNLTYGKVTVTFTSHGFIAGDNIVVTGMGNSAYNTIRGRVMTVADANHFTYFVTASGTDTSGGGTITRANQYSLALQTNTAYFWRLGGAGNTCGASPATGTFTTMNWPNGDTWAENMPLDSTGTPIYPTVPESQAATVSIIDPITGVLGKPMGLFSDDYGVTWTPGGTGSHCTSTADGNGFNHCYQEFGNSGASELYGVNESTGEVRFLGQATVTSGLGECSLGSQTPVMDPNQGSLWDDSDPNTWYGTCLTATNHMEVFKAVYNGNDVAVVNPGSGQHASFATLVMLTPASVNTLDQLMTNFDANFDFSVLGPGGVLQNYQNGGYLTFQFRRWNQASPTWDGVFNLGDKLPPDGTCGGARLNCPRITAAMASWGPGLGATSCAGSLPTPCTGLYPSRWEGTHGQGQWNGPSQGWDQWSGSYLTFANDGTMGPFEMTLNQGGGLNATDATDTMTVTSTVVGSHGSAGDPMSASCPAIGGATTGGGIPCSSQTGAQAYLDQALPGDLIQWELPGSLGGSNEIDQVTARNSATSLTIARGCRGDGSVIPNVIKCDRTHSTTHANGDKMAMVPRQFVELASFTWWNFTNDVHGHDQTNTYLLPGVTVYDPSHWGGWYPYIIDEGWNIKNATPWGQSSFQSPEDYALPNVNSFSGISNACAGSACNMYPKYTPANSSTQQWFWDSAAYSGSGFLDPVATVVSSGSGYVIERYNFQTVPANPFSATLPYFSVSGIHPLVDISAPGSALPASSAGNYEFCIVHVSNECVSGSTVNQVYGNFPAATVACAVNEAGVNTNNDWCVNNMFSGGQGIVQAGVIPANQIGTGGDGRPIYGASKSRKLVQGLYMNPRWVYSTGNNSFPDDGWVHKDNCMADPYINPLNSSSTETTNGACLSEVYMYKVPTQPTPDGLDRSSYLTIPITIGAVGVSPSYAVVEYGYEENEPTRGTTFPPTIHYYCQQYQAACFWNGSAATPAYTATSGTHLSLSGTSNLNIGVPQRTMGYQLLYFNASNVQVGTSGLQFVAIDPAAIGAPAIQPSGTRGWLP